MVSSNLHNVEMRPVADMGMLVEFGDIIDDEIHANVLKFDHAVNAAQIEGVIETIPTFASVFVAFDPLVLDFAQLRERLVACLSGDETRNEKAKKWQVPVCYEGEYAPDLAELSHNVGLSEEEVISLHHDGQYKVYMYGFAPGYAYMGGVPNPIQLPRKKVPVMNVPSAALMVAGPQCLITTITMPSGWWVIGRAAKTPLQSDSNRPFLFNVGDQVEFVRVSEAEFKRQAQKG